MEENTTCAPDPSTSRPIPTSILCNYKEECSKAQMGLRCATPTHFHFLEILKLLWF